MSRPLLSASRVLPLTRSQVLAGIAFLVGGMWSLSGLDASGKYLMGAGIAVPLLVLSLVRYGVHLLLALILVLPLRGRHGLASRVPRAQLLRGVSMLAATLLFFTTLHRLPQAQATAINFLAPLLVLAAAPWWLGEPPLLSRWIAAVAGFAGVLVLVRPGAGLDALGTVLGLVTACTMAVQYVATRQVAPDDPYTTLLWSGGVGSAVLLLMLPLYWRDAVQVLHRLDALQWLVLLGTGFWGCLGHYLQIQAYWRAPASLLAPFTYFQIVAAAALGWLIWGQFPDALSWLGIAIICASGVVIGMLEWRR